MYEGVDTVVLHNELAYEDVLPVGWRVLQKPLDMASVATLTERNVRTLQICATIEEQGPVEKAEDKNLHSADLLRLEQCGARTFLVGEALMREADVEAATRRLLKS